MAEQADWLATVRGLLEVVGASDVTELQYQGRALRLRLQRRPGAAGGRALAAPDGARSDLHRLTAPLTGVYYAAPAPEAEPYVQEGDWLEPGMVLGLIETMKVYNEVLADGRGRLLEIRVASGQLVQQGDVLFTIDPRAPAPGLETP
jgi:acetyl-CoA carboxylase biotin carboxyl carrier protein